MKNGPRIPPGAAFLLLSFAVIVDILQIILSFLIIGIILNTFITILVAPIFLLFLKHYGVDLSFARAGGRLLAGIGAEFLPLSNWFFGWTIAIASIVVMDRGSTFMRSIMGRNESS